MFGRTDHVNVPLVMLLAFKFVRVDPFQMKLHPVIDHVTFAFPESQRLAQRFAVAPRSF